MEGPSGPCGTVELSHLGFISEGAGRAPRPLAGHTRTKDFYDGDHYIRPMSNRPEGPRVQRAGDDVGDRVTGLFGWSPEVSAGFMDVLEIAGTDPTGIETLTHEAAMIPKASIELSYRALALITVEGSPDPDDVGGWHSKTLCGTPHKSGEAFVFESSRGGDWGNFPECNLGAVAARLRYEIVPGKVREPVYGAVLPDDLRADTDSSGQRREESR